MKREQGRLLFSPSDLVRYVQSPFASWMQRLCLEVPETKKFMALNETPFSDKVLDNNERIHDANYKLDLEIYRLKRAP
jgi:hypothetical protein